MKNFIKTISCIGAAMLVLASCDDMLDVSPRDRLTPETFFKNEKELRSFSMNFYGMLPGGGNDASQSAIGSLYMENTDLYIQMTIAPEVQGIRTIPSSGNGWSWGALRNVNTMLDYLYQCPDEDVRIKYEALARFFRAYFYFEKVKRFGDVPWYDTQVGSKDEEQLNRPRDPREFIMQKMIADIDFAIENLPAEKSVYEVTKWTAMALKSRFCLFEGTFRKYHTEFDYGAGANDWRWYLQQCADVSREFMNESGYTLHTDGGVNEAYYRLFTTFNATDLMDEVILARNFNREYGVTHNCNYTMNIMSMGRPGMTRKLVASYLMKNGSRFTDKTTWETITFPAEATDRDPRLAQSIRTSTYHRIGETALTPPQLQFSITGYHPAKYVTTKEQDSNGSDIDLIIFRSAEVLLNYAEAKAEMEDLTQTDLDLSLNKLRDRVGMPHLMMATANANPDPFLTNVEWGGYRNVTGANKGVILEIRRERAIELCQEGAGLRYFDIMRWKEGKVFEQQKYGMYFPGPGEYDLNGDGAKDVLLYTTAKPAGATAPVSFQLGVDIILSEGTSGHVNPHKSTTCTWNEDRDYLYPIPTNERSLTHGALTQNPGWNDGLSF